MQDNKKIKEKNEKDELLAKAIQAVQAVDSKNSVQKNKEKIHFGYIRVSTEEQDLDRQKIALERYALRENIKFKAIYEDKASGTNLNRPQLETLRHLLRDGDIVVVESYYRMCRSTIDMLNLIDEFEASGVGFVSIKENFDTTNAMGRLILTVMAAVGEAERKQMLERQRNGIKKAQAEGKYKGRKPIEKPDNFDFCLDKYLNSTKIKPYPFRQLLKDTNLKKSTLIRFIEKEKKKKRDILDALDASDGSEETD